MTENYSNNWHNDDYQNQSTFGEQKFFNYNETYLQKREPKKRINKNTLKFVSIIIAAAIFGSAVTGGAFSIYLPKYIEGRISSYNALNTPNPVTYVNQVTEEASPAESLSGVLTIPQIAKKVGPAVIGIVSTIPQNTFFGVTQATGSGSGIIITEDGYLVTNNHVIEGASKITIYLSNGEQKSATVVGTDKKTDLAVLKLEKGKYPYAELGSSSSLEVGELSVAIGNPLGMEFAGSVTVGYISALNRNVEVDGKTLNLIQTDAAINSGNSGGALVNRYGQVIGINTLKIASAGVEGLGFAIPIDEAKPIFNDLISHGYVKGRPVIGIMGRDLTPDIAKYYNYPEGIFVEQVSPDSGAAKAGIKRGDIVTHIDGQRVKSIKELNKIRDTKKAGDVIVLEIDRSGEILKINVTLGEDNSKN